MEKGRIASDVPIPDWDPLFGQQPAMLPALWRDALGHGLE